jgi:transcription initiation factor TFIID subunit TAF12
MEEDNLEKQLIPYLESIINQTLEMIESISEEENFDEGEVNELLYQLQDDFGEYINMLSSKTRGRILEIHHKLLNLDNVYESTNL